jgi:16S rRNA (guanine1207-N2)-methyltransferase
MLIINDGKLSREEELGGMVVQSSGGVPPAYRALQEYLPQSGILLDFGSWQGIAGLVAVRRGAQVTFAHHRHSWLTQVQLNLKANGVAQEVYPLFPIAGSFDTIILQDHDSAEASQMLAAQAASSLKPGGVMYLVISGQTLPPLGFESLAAGEGWGIYRQGRGASTELPWQQYDFTLRGVEGRVWTLPGAFSPGGLDAGTRLMLEEMVVAPGERVLDLGSGNGVVGFVAEALGGTPVFVDEDFLALTACKRNLEERGLAAQVIFSSNPFAVEGEFDCILSNPPYHTDYGVAGSFIEFARRRLRPGGRLYMVVKRPDWYQNRLRAVFGGCQAVTGEGYTLLVSENRGAASGKSQVKTTRKHQRRLAQSGKKRK